jgi:hypothetical protein
MPGIAALGKLFLKKMQAKKKRPSPRTTFLAAAYARLLLVVGEIIRRKSRRGRQHFVTLNKNAAAAARHEFVFV